VKQFYSNFYKNMKVQVNIFSDNFHVISFLEIQIIMTFSLI
jgi:hypothetical protein